MKRSKSSRLRRGGTKSWLVMAAGPETTAVSRQLKQLGRFSLHYACDWPFYGLCA